MGTPAAAIAAGARTLPSQPSCAGSSRGLSNRTVDCGWLFGHNTGSRRSSDGLAPNSATAAPTLRHGCAHELEIAQRQLETDTPHQDDWEILILPQKLRLWGFKKVINTNGVLRDKLACENESYCERCEGEAKCLMIFWR